MCARSAPWSCDWRTCPYEFDRVPMSRLRILADENIPKADTVFAPLGTVRRIAGRAIEAAMLADTDVLLVRSVTRVDSRLLGDSPIRFVGSATSGTDHLDREYLDRRGTGWAHAPGANANSVVEYVLSAIACVGDKLEQVLGGAPVGIIGYGHIGKALASRLRALGIDYRIYDPWLAQSSIDRPAPLERVLQAGVIAVHCELTDRRPWPSRHLLGERALSTIPPDTLLINASRGAVLDNRALHAQLTRGRGPVAVLDVWEGEPTIAAELLRQVRLGTPHIAGYSQDGKLEATRMLFRAACRHLGVSANPGLPGVSSAPLITLPEGLQGPELLRHLLQSHCDIPRDDRALRQATLGVDVRLAASGFDRLRRHYPPRRELRGALIDGGHLAEPNIGLVQALGCQLCSPGEGAA